jgi:hypothetical protein
MSLANVSFVQRSNWADSEQLSLKLPVARQPLHELFIMSFCLTNEA